MLANTVRQLFAADNLSRRHIHMNFCRRYRDSELTNRIAMKLNELCKLGKLDKKIILRLLVLINATKTVRFQLAHKAYEYGAIGDEPVDDKN